MSIATEKVLVTCPQCGKKLAVSAESVGKQGRCPSCDNVFPLQAAITAPVAEPRRVAPPLDALRAAAAGNIATEPLPSSRPNSPPVPANSSLSAAATASSNKYRHGFGWEHRGWDAGALGGLAMMAIALVWFFGGLACGIIFYYPPILFVIGLIGFFRGLLTGKLTRRG